MTHQNSAARQEREPSALVFVAKVIFISIAVVLTIVLLAALPEAPWIPLVIALAIALVLGFSVELAMRSRHRDQRPPVVRMAGRRDVALRRPEDCPAQLETAGHRSMTAPPTRAQGWWDVCSACSRRSAHCVSCLPF